MALKRIKQIDVGAIYVLWLREMKGLWRAKSRVVGSLGMPLFFLAFLGLGFSHAAIPEMPEGMTNTGFFTTGIIGMTMVFSSVFAGISVLWDKEFGFLKEVMVAPVSRLSIVLGRTAGGSTTALMQGVMILLLSTLLGFEIKDVLGLIASLAFMCLISFTFVGMGLVFASFMRDMHGFPLVMNFIVFPIIIFSGALFPIETLPSWLLPAWYIDPLTYGVDGLRATLLGVSEISVLFDLFISFAVSAGMITAGAYLFERTDVGK